MYLIAIAWMYVALMMALAEAMHPQGSLLGALVTFLLYGVGPLSLVLYLVGTPMRRKAQRRRQQAEAQVEASADPQHPGASLIDAPDQGGHAAGLAVPPVRKEP